MEGLFSSSNPFKRQPAGESAPKQKKIEEKNDSLPRTRLPKQHDARAEQPRKSRRKAAEDPEVPSRKRKREEVSDQSSESDEDVEDGGSEDSEVERILEQRPELEAKHSRNFDSEEKLRRTIFVGNLPVNVKKKTLIREFECYGSVQSTRVRSVPVGTIDLPRKAALSTGQVSETRSSVNAYVVFEEQSSAEAALAHNMKQFGDKHIRVDIARPPAGKRKREAVTYDKSKTIFVGNVPFDAEEEELYELFSSKGPEQELEAVRIVRDQRTNVGKGFAFVMFKSEAGVKHSLMKRKKAEIRGRSLRLRRLVDNNKTTLRASSSSGQERKRQQAYEGTRAGGKQRKVVTPAQSRPAVGKLASSRANGKKRPAVAARKAAEKAAKRK